MTPAYNKVHNRFKYNGFHFNHEDLKEVAYSLIKEGEPYEKTIGSFLTDWLNDKDHLFVKTSGSTGQPKTIKLKKQAMVNSAIATGDFFYLQPGNTALHCLPSHYIAGKMMFVRAMILGLEIDCVQPSSHPIFDYEKHYDFCAMVPLQLERTINYVYNISTIIVGGSKVEESLLDKIKDCKSKFYETYGMTETVTHVAVKALQSQTIKEDTYFKALPNVSFITDKRNCLVINAPKLVKDILVTNDVVDLESKTAFKWLGRYDNVINSGGVKLFPEQIEAKLQAILKQRFFVASLPDKTLGEQLILVVENSSESIETLSKVIKDLKSLSKFEIPKQIFTMEKFTETETGKIQRKKTIEALLG